jgi:hypothetical protein
MSWQRRVVFAAIHFVLVVCLFACVAWSQETDMDHHAFQIAAINYFGYEGLSLEKVRSVLPLHIGDTLTYATFSRKPINDAVLSAVGKGPTDVNVVCCDDSHRLLVFIGLPGSTSRPFPTNAAPSGEAHLDEAGLHLYEQERSVLEKAVVRGSAGEGDSQGYAISNDPSVKAVKLAMRVYAVEHESELRDVLETAKDPTQRRAAAALLGYARRSQTQADALAKAMNDPDEEVRNNAVRALSLLSAAPGNAQMQINMQSLVNLLYSGLWTDRNKASFLLLDMTNSRNPRVLSLLRKEAMGPLIEGASWTGDTGHNTTFLTILGRIGNIGDDKLNEMLKENNSKDIISAALSSTDTDAPGLKRR